MPAISLTPCLQSLEPTIKDTEREIICPLQGWTLNCPTNSQSKNCIVPRLFCPRTWCRYTNNLMLLSNTVLSKSFCSQLLGSGPFFRLSKAHASYTLAQLVSSPDSTLTASSPISMPMPGPTQTAQPRLVSPIWTFPNLQVLDKWHILFVRELCDLHIRHTRHIRSSLVQISSQ